MPTKAAIIVSILVGSLMARAQVFITQPGVPVLAAGTPQQSLAHRDVILNAQMEETLSQEAHRSNKFYNNPVVAQGLAKESWLTDKEMPVFDRAADHIPRSQIYKIVKSAGFIRRR